jgi:mono/diheme cytochrome c family protein
MKKYIIISLCIVLIVAASPFAFIATMRMIKSDNPRIHLIPDMDNQPKFKAQSMNPFFADRRAMRPRIAGTVARGEWYANPIIHDGTLAGAWATEIPETVTEELIQRGQGKFTIYCVPCHGQAGNGDGIVAKRAAQWQEGTWTPPTSLHDATVKQQPPGQIFYTISHGIRTMPTYGAQIAPYDRWAIVAYVRTLQQNPNTNPTGAPSENSGALEKK